MTRESQGQGWRTRRDFLLATAALWSAARLRAQQHHSTNPAAPAKSYVFSFFDQRQRDTLQVLMERFIPGDARSPGAVGAKADEYIDFILSHGDEAMQRTWKQGLASYGEAIHGMSTQAVDAFLEKQAAGEFAPSPEIASSAEVTSIHAGETFFVILKAAIAEGFYTSSAGINQELGYQGMGYLLDFAGCTHASHRAPDNWQPLLRQREQS